MEPSALGFVALPGVLAGLGWFGAARALRDAGRRAAALPWLVALAYVAGHAGLSGLSALPLGVTDYLPHVALLAALAATLEAQQRSPVRGALVWAPVALGAAWLLVRPVAAREPLATGALMVTLPALALGLSLWSVRRGNAGRGASAQGLVGFAVACAVVVACALSGTLVVGQHAAMVAAGVAGFGVAAALSRSPLDAGPALTVATTLGWACVTLTWFYAEMHWQVLLLVASVPPVVALLGWLLRARTALVQAAATLVLAGLTGWRALVVSPLETPTDDAGGYDYGYGYPSD